MPVWSKDTYESYISQKDTNILIDELPSYFDIIYLDPPYNQHSYSNNYYMLNIIIENKEPQEISNVSGIPANWNRSLYNYKKSASEAMESLLQKSLEKSNYVILSYNNEGIITKEEWDLLLEPYQVKEYKIRYDTYKGSRNLKERSNKVIEVMYVIQK